MNSHFLLDVEAHVRAVFSERLTPHFTYHNLEHTLSVVEVTSNLCRAYNLNQEDTIPIVVAAWFHDIGHFFDSSDHEVAGARICAEFLSTKNVDQEAIEEVNRLIMATNIRAKGVSLPERIIKDSDIHYIGTQHYFELSEGLRQEWDHFSQSELSDMEWYGKNIEFFEHHQWLTHVGENWFAKQKQQNLTKIQSLFQESQNNG